MQTTFYTRTADAIILLMLLYERMWISIYISMAQSFTATLFL